MTGSDRRDTVRLDRDSAPAEVRAAIRAGTWSRSTRGVAGAYTHAGLAVVERRLAFEFLRFCVLNSRACPVVDVLAPGEYAPSVADGQADIRTDIARYRVFENGRLVDEPSDIRKYWRPDLVAFLIGCSYTFEEALESAGVALPGRAEGRGNPLYRTSWKTRPSGPFSGPMVVSMRPIARHLVDKVHRVTGPLSLGHGAPIHVGDPEVLGITDLAKPDWGHPLPVGDDEVPVYWACSLTAEQVGRSASVPFFITHFPSCTFVTDLPVGVVPSAHP